MSKDIRSFFSISPKGGGSKPVLKANGLSSTSTKNKKKRQIIESDSDDEPTTPAVKKTKKSDEKKKPETSKYFAASASDVFGSEPVKRVVKTVGIKPTVDKIEDHDDEEFEAALLQLDEEKEWNSHLEKRNETKKEASDKPINSPKKTNGTHSPRKETKSPAKPAMKKNSHDFSPSPERESPSKKKSADLSPSPKKDSSSKKTSADFSPSPKKDSPSKKKSATSSSPSIKDFLTKKKSPDFSPSPKKDAARSPPLEKTFASSATKKDKSPSKTEDSSKKKHPLSPDAKVSKKLFVKEESAAPKSTSPPKSKQESKASEEPEKKKIKLEKEEAKIVVSKPESKEKTLPVVSEKPKPEIPSQPSKVVPVNDKLWVEKYKPSTIKQIVGQQGAKSCVAKLLNWLKNWSSNHSGNKKLVRPSPWAKDDDGAYFKAALLSGRPGIGKTTTAHLVCKELGFDIVEFNASDTRSKKLLHQEVTELLTSKSLNPYFTGSKTVSSKHCLVMDEVDGMAGNEDRGGMQELIQLIKTAKVPIICMCNDRSHPKMRSLLNYCYDLSFSRPRVEQLRGAMMSICFKENLKIPVDILDSIINNCEQDIRLILNHLSMLSVNKLNDLEALKKHVKMGPWDVLRKVFSAEDHKTMSIHDKSDLFFHDYSIAPLFVQENYLNVVPRIPECAKKSKRMELFARAAESISLGDLTDKNLRSHNNWSLLPTQAMFASVIPGTILEGYIGRQINFPAWLGKNSRRNKLDRLLQEIQQHTRLRVSASKQAINLDYLVPLRNLILQPLISSGSDGVPQTIAALQNYDLLKEDLDSILELSQWPDKKDPMSQIESKVKAALTRAYNKIGPSCPYAVLSVKKGAKKSNDNDLGGMDDDEGEVEDDDDEKDDVQDDAMIVVKKPNAKKGGASDKASTSKAGGSESGSRARGGPARGTRGGSTRGQNKRGKK